MGRFGRGFPQKLTPVGATRLPVRVCVELASVIEGSERYFAFGPNLVSPEECVNVRRIAAVI